ncbi:MAG: hypothetical protein R3A80_05690 [Bdellovibrionota bacterium]
MGVLKFLGQTLFFFIILTLIGQLRWNGLSLENYYHQSVNSRSFQKSWATATAPFQWVGERFGLTRETSRPSHARY